MSPCDSDRDCGDGDECEAGFCIENGEASQAETGEPPGHDDSRPGCSPFDVECPGVPSECDVHGDCEIGEVCNPDGSCAPSVPVLPVCDPNAYPALHSASLGLDDPIEVDALGFVEIDGGDVLFVSRNDRVRLVDPRGVEADPEHVMPGDGVLFAGAVTDLDDDGTAELVGAVREVGVVVIPDPVAPGTPAIVADLPTIDSMVALDYDGDGRDDLAVGALEGAWVLLGGTGPAFESIALTEQPAMHLLSGRVVRVPDGIAVSTPVGLQIWAAYPDGDGQPDLTLLDSFAQLPWNPLFGELGGSGSVAVGYRGLGSSWTMLRTRVDGGAVRDTAVLAWNLVGAQGDLDGDGLDDLVLANLERVFWLPGSEPGAFPCAVEHSIDRLYWSSIAIGDLDQDGRVDVAIADGTDVLLMRAPV